MEESKDEPDLQEEKQEHSSSGFIEKRNQSESGLRRSSLLAQRQQRDYSQMETGNFLAALEDGEQEVLRMIVQVKEYTTNV